MSYNILADSLAHKHQRNLYRRQSPDVLEWPRRRRALLAELAALDADVVCLQEVEHACELSAALGEVGYRGVAAQRSGGCTDGLAVFWKDSRVRVVSGGTIQFATLGLKDNVAQILVFEAKGGEAGAEAAAPRGAATAREGGGGRDGDGRAAPPRGSAAAASPPLSADAAALCPASLTLPPQCALNADRASALQARAVFLGAKVLPDGSLAPQTPEDPEASAYDRPVRGALARLSQRGWVEGSAVGEEDGLGTLQADDDRNDLTPDARGRPARETTPNGRPALSSSTARWPVVGRPEGAAEARERTHARGAGEPGSFGMPGEELGEPGVPPAEDAAWGDPVPSATGADAAFFPDQPLRCDVAGIRGEASAEDASPGASPGASEGSHPGLFVRPPQRSARSSGLLVGPPPYAPPPRPPPVARSQGGASHGGGASPAAAPRLGAGVPFPSGSVSLPNSPRLEPRRIFRPQEIVDGAAPGADGDAGLASAADAPDAAAAAAAAGLSACEPPSPSSSSVSSSSVSLSAASSATSTGFLGLGGPFAGAAPDDAPHVPGQAAGGTGSSPGASPSAARASHPLSGSASDLARLDVSLGGAPRRFDVPNRTRRRGGRQGGPGAPSASGSDAPCDPFSLPVSSIPSSSSSPPSSPYRFVVGNIHVLFNPSRGDVKLGQIRTLFEAVDRARRTGRVSAPATPLEGAGAGASAASPVLPLPALICGDFNTCAGSDLYHFARDGELDLAQVDRRQVSGQMSAPPRVSWREALRKVEARPRVWDRCHEAAAAAEATSRTGTWVAAPWDARGGSRAPLWGAAAGRPPPALGGHRRQPRPWTYDELAAALGEAQAARVVQGGCGASPALAAAQAQAATNKAQVKAAAKAARRAQRALLAAKDAEESAEGGEETGTASGAPGAARSASAASAASAASSASAPRASGAAEAPAPSGAASSSLPPAAAARSGRAPLFSGLAPLAALDRSFSQADAPAVAMDEDDDVNLATGTARIPYAPKRGSAGASPSPDGAPETARARRAPAGASLGVPKSASTEGEFPIPEDTPAARFPKAFPCHSAVSMLDVGWHGLGADPAAAAPPRAASTASAASVASPLPASSVPVAPPPPPPAEPIIRHPLKLRSAYAAVGGCEPVYTTCHDAYVGTVDYVWFTEDDPRRREGLPPCARAPAAGQPGARPALRLSPRAVLEPPTLRSLLMSMPTDTWPSDHVALVADFDLVLEGEEP